MTVVFADLVGSTELGERLDAEMLREILDRYFGSMRTTLEHHGGVVEKYIGDAIMAVFGFHDVHEDDALRAVRAAVEMRSNLVDLNDELRRAYRVTLANRTAVNTGEVVAGAPDATQRLVTGDAVNLAARLEQAAKGGDILIGESTFRLVRDFVEAVPLERFRVKGKADQVVAFRVIAVRPEHPTADASTLHPLVGRVEELRQLRSILHDVVGASRARLATIVGEAGVGKSRLAAELARSEAETVTTLLGRCLAYGDGITFWPIAQVVRSVSGISESDDHATIRSKLAAVGADARTTDPVVSLLEGSSGYFVEETSAAVRRLLEVHARRNPLLVVIEDVHWAERAMVDFLDRAAARSHAPIMFLCTARPDLIERYPAWGTRSDNTMLELSSLPEEQCSQLLALLTKDQPADPALRARVLDAAAGNPLFVEQIAHMLIDETREGRLGDPGLAVREHELAVPPSISALLDARINRLRPEPRAVLERAAVIGRVFYRGALDSLVDPRARPNLDVLLGELSERGFLQATPSDLEGEAAMAFRHLLIRDAAYRALLKRTRADLHERFAHWLQTKDLDTPGLREILGYHLERSYHVSRELGLEDERTASLAARAADVLGQAGRLAATRGDVSAASNLLERAVALMPDGRERSILRLLSSEQLLEEGRLEEATGALAEAAEWPSCRFDAALRGRAKVAALTISLFKGTLAHVTARRELLAIRPDLDQPGTAQAELLAGIIDYDEGSMASALISFEHAAESGDDVVRARALDWATLAIAFGPTPVAEATRRIRGIISESHPGSRVEASALSALAYLESLAGRCDEARDLVHQSRQTYEELGMTPDAATCSQSAAGIALLCGDPSSVIEELEADGEILARLGEIAYLETTYIRLAQLRFAIDDLAGAEEAVTGALHLSQKREAVDIGEARGLQAMILARRGRLQDALEMAQRTLEASTRGDRHNARLAALSDLSEILILAGRPTEALPLIARARDLCSAKGDAVSLERLTDLLETASG